MVRHGCPGKPCGLHVRAGLKPAPTIAAPVVARSIAAYHTGSWHQRQTDTSVNSDRRRQINPVSLYYCDNGRQRRGGFQTRPNHRRACCRPNHRRARRKTHHRRLCNWLSAKRCVPTPIQRLCNWPYIVTVSEYSPHTERKESLISPTVAPAFTASRISGTKFSLPRAASSMFLRHCAQTASLRISRNFFRRWHCSCSSFGLILSRGIVSVSSHWKSFWPTTILRFCSISS